MPGKLTPIFQRILRSPLALAAILVFCIDRLSKFWVLAVLDLGHWQVIEVWPPFLVFRLAWNRGINFGFLNNIGVDAGVMRWTLIAVAVAISVALVWWARRRRGTPGGAVLATGAGIVIGGALSNAWDRIWYTEAAVFDFLNMSCCGIVNPYAFNIADVAIFAGAALIAFKA